MRIEIFRRKGICIVTLEGSGCYENSSILASFRSAAKATKYAKRCAQSLQIPVFNGLQ